MPGKKEQSLRSVAIADLQAGFKRFSETKWPKLQAFRSQLVRQSGLLRGGHITERDFFNSLTADREPLQLIWVRTKKIGEDAETIDVERTSDHKLKIRSEQEGAWPRITTTVGLSKKGHLCIKHVDARYVIQEGIMKPGVVEGPIIHTDEPGKSISKLEAGQALIDSLRYVVPDPGDLK